MIHFISTEQNMVDTLANLEAVYNKWSERNPWSSGQKSSSRANTQTKPKANLPDYETVVEKGRQWYRSNYRDMAPPPIRRTTDRRRNRNRDRNATSTPFTEVMNVKIQSTVLTKLWCYQTTLYLTNKRNKVID